MGARGPSAMPTSLKLLEGNPGKRPLNFAEPIPDGLPIKPKTLSRAAGETWNMLIESMPPGIYTKADSKNLAAYCEACAMQEQASVHLQAGIVIDDKISPWMRIFNEQVKLMSTLGSQLGCTPGARANLKTPPKKAASKFDGLIK